MRWGRWWLAVAYVLASLQAQVPHAHHRSSDGSPLEWTGECDESRPHVAGHHVAAPSEGSDTCPACQHRGQHAFWAVDSTPAPESIVSTLDAIDPPATFPGSFLRPCVRGPPTA